MAEETDRMSRSVSRLLYLARTDGGNFYPMFEKIDISFLVSEEFCRLKPMAGTRSYVLNAEPDVRVYGDAESLRRGIQALIENAINYTADNGHIEVTVSAEEGRCTLRVADDGIGIGQEEQSLIFHRFYRSQQARQVDPEGSGLGLSIVKKVAVLHKAKLNVNSAPGQGAAFEMEIPS
jgi:signal transduction histidine kinase